MENRHWFTRQLRMVQTVLREIDIIGYDAKSVVGYLKEIDANCIIVNAGGVIDFFDNRTPLNRPNSFQNGQDMLGDLLREAHKQDIRVMVRVDFRGVESVRYEQKPDWFAQNPDGGPHIGWARIHRPCYNGIYPNEHAVAFIRELMSRYDVDGIWENAVGFGIGPCYCKTCRDLYRGDTGKEIPVGDDYASPLFDEYRAWKAGCADRHIALLRAAVKSFGEDKAFCSEIFGMFHSSNALMTGIDLYNAKEHFDFLVSPAFLDGCASPSRKYDTLTYAASSIRFLKAIEPDKQAVLLYGNNGTKWRYVKAPSLETKIWLWEAAGVGGGFWNCLFNGQHPGAAVDSRNAFIERETYRYLMENEEYLTGQLPVCDVGIFYSKASRDTLGNDDESKDEYGVFIRGVERVLTERHIQYTFIPDLDLTYEKLAACKALLLPNGACLSAEQMALIRRYVENGGGLIASYKSSLYDEKGRRREDFGLKDLFGVSFTGMTRDTSSDCYQMVRDPAHPLLRGMGADRTRMVMNEGSTLLCTVTEGSGAHTVLSYVPKIFNQPPEYAWIPEEKTDYPTAVVNRFGKGRVVYFANQADKLCWTNGHEDFIDTYCNAIFHVITAPLSLETNAPASVHICLMHRAGNHGQMVLSAVNTTSAALRPVKELVPVTDIEIALPGADLEAYTILKQDGAIQVENGKKGEEGKAVRISLERLQAFAAVYLRVR